MSSLFCKLFCVLTRSSRKVPEGKRPLGRPRRRWADNIKMDLQEVGGGCGDWIELAQDRDRWRAPVSTVMNFRVPKKSGEFFDSCRTNWLLKTDSVPWSKCHNL